VAGGEIPEEEGGMTNVNRGRTRREDEHSQTWM